MSDLYTKLIAGVIFPLHERLKGRSTLKTRRFLENSQWWTKQQLEELQFFRLRELLRHAYRYVPYYKGLLEQAGLTGGDVASLGELQKLPMLTKSIVRANSGLLKSAQAGRLTRFNTGGSSGEPLIFYIGPDRVRHDVAAKWRATRWWGVDIGDREIVVWGSPIELNNQDRLRALRDRLLRTKLLPAFEMSPERIAEFVGEILKAKPKVLFGYPSSLALIARYAQSHGMAMDGVGMEVVFVTAERLYPDQRGVLESVFGCRVANGYGGRDSGFIAHECLRGGMHISAEDIIVEIIGAHGEALPPGEAGEVVVTHLATRDFPFIRYRTGDIAVMEDKPCPCGRGLPLLKEIQGRTTDFITAADGTVMHGLALIYVLRDLPGIKAFKIIQENLMLTRVLLTPGEGFDPGCVAGIQRDFKARLGQDVRVDVEQVPEISSERSGKFRYVISKVAT